MEQISDGFALEYRPDGIIVYYIFDARRETLDLLFTTSTRHDQEFAAKNQHLRRMLSIQGHITAPTPYALHKLVEAEKLTPRELRESFALVVTNALTYQIMALFINRNLPAYTRSITKIFHSEDQALAWLAQRWQELGQ